MKYLVFTGNEFGIDIELEDGDKFINDKNDAENKYNYFLEEYGCVFMYSVDETGLKHIK